MEFVKVCKWHGGLLEEHIIHTKKRGKPFTVCKLCRSISRAKTIAKNFGKCIHHGILTPELTKKDGRCRICHRKSAGKKRNENREWFNNKMAQDRAKNPEKWNKIYKKVYNQQRAKYGSVYSLKKCCDARGITLEQYQEMLEKQNGVCAICFLPETRKDGRTQVTGRLAIDHCHKTNKVRGLLCHDCNTGIGKFYDDIPRIIRAAKYIKQNQL